VSEPETRCLRGTLIEPDPGTRVARFCHLDKGHDEIDGSDHETVYRRELYSWPAEARQR
jgi:hypothetical protein